MSRSDRLIRLMQVMRRLPSPVTASRLAVEMEISERSIYRDIQSLRASGAIIDGEAGYGYTFGEDPHLPPMQFDGDEVDALALGLISVMNLGDSDLRFAAENALAKLEAILPEAMRPRLRFPAAATRSFQKKLVSGLDLSKIRNSVWNEKALHFHYVTLAGKPSERKVWPLAIVFLDTVQVLVAWCCLRDDFRTFRLDRIKKLEFLDESFRPKRVGLLRDYFGRKENDHGPASS
ncbi:MAG: YafY family transcriptional regulator [Rhizobiaceae bacterium]|nr:YafY family transcriptional regulator [Rhizobiaceae bacterium]MBL4732342.1 YafY family transcriptional regulator [Rhizobiaceae bacterium]